MLASARTSSWLPLAACIALAMLPPPTLAEPAVSQAQAGATAETAIVLPQIADEFHGVAAEQAYIASHFPTWHIEYQTRTTQNGRNYDVLGMIKPDRTRVQLFFDITDWVGK